MTTKALLFVGAGAVGSYIGAFLARSGQDVTFIVREIDAGARRPSPDNIAIALTRSGSRLGA